MANLVRSRTLLLALLWFLHVGCDGVVGSDKRWDACGECGGSNSSCRLYSGLFSNHANLQAGYNLVTTLPRGACNISVDEMNPSRNYLALRRPNGGNFLLNGDWQINWAGEYDAGGTTFVYRPQDATRGESLTSRGPLLEPVDLMVLYERSNLAIKYEYRLPISAGMGGVMPGPAGAPAVIRSPHGFQVQPPQPPGHRSGHNGHHGGHHGQSHRQTPLLTYNPEDPTVKDGSFIDSIDNRRHSSAPGFPFSSTGGQIGDEPQPPNSPLRPRSRKIRKFVWRQTGFTECSKPCGGGVQTANVICVREVNSAPVPDKRCHGQEKPSPQNIRCNQKPCPASWEAGEWEPCSTTCGTGTQIRAVVCRQLISPTLTMKVAEGACLGPFPERMRRCQVKPCSLSGARWSASEWGMCAAPCGKGSRTRTVRCVSPDGSDLNLDSCNLDDKPEEQESCDAGPCSSGHSHGGAQGQWLMSDWAQKCSEECGTGVQTRRVVCSLGPDHACDPTNRPEASRACSSSKLCSGKWFEGPWGQCSASCGQGRQSRDVVCVAFVRGQFQVALDMNCQASIKPTVERACSERPCGPEWFMADWGTCSTACGTGSQRRDVRCLDETQRQTSTCPHELRPTVRRPCNTHPCNDPGQNHHADIVNSSEDLGNQVQHPRDRLHQRPHHQVSTALTHPGHHPNHHNRDEENKAGDQAQPPENEKKEEEEEEEECKDKFSNCHLVAQARLCKYKYYRTACCFACSHRKTA